MKRTEDVRTAILTAKKEVRSTQVLRIKAMATVVLSALGESDERDRVEPCLSRVQESWAELSKQYKKAQYLLKQLGQEQEDRLIVVDRAAVQLAQELRKNFKTIQTHLREQLKVALPQFIAETLYCELQQPEDVLKRVKEDENSRKQLKTLESIEARLTPQGTAEIAFRWTIGFSALLQVSGTAYPSFHLHQLRPSANLAAFLRLLQAHVETKTHMTMTLVAEICKWVEKNLLEMFAATCKGCGRVLSFAAGQPMLAMVFDHKGDYYHEDCIRESLETSSS